MKIIGLDLGYSDITAAIGLFNNGEFVRMHNLCLVEFMNYVIPAEVECYGVRFNHFWASPKHFAEEIHCNGETICRRALMSFLLRKVMKGIRDNNPEIADGEQIMLVVGCPASEEWLSEKKEYEQFIMEETGVAEVRVIPDFSVSQRLSF